MEILFPLFLKLKGRKCLVVGAGEIGESKIASLLDAGGSLQVVAPCATDNVQEWARKGQVHWQKRKFRDADLADCFLVIAATSSSKLHKQIFRLARRLGVLCNVVDVPELCDFYYPAVVRRGSLQVAISTGGESPALAQRLRKELEAQFGPVRRALRIKKNSCTNWQVKRRSENSKNASRNNPASDTPKHLRNRHSAKSDQHQEFQCNA